MDTFRLIIKTPLSEVFNDAVENTYIVTNSGEIGIFSGHASLITPITFSLVSIKTKGKIRNILIRSGMLHFSNDENECTILAYAAYNKEKIDTSGAKSYLAKIDEILKSGKDLSEYSFKYLENERVGLVKQIEETESK